MRYAVVDTNVLVVANGEYAKAGDQCLLEAQRFLRDVQARESLVLDDAWRILGEYRGRVERADPDGVGRHFFKWAARAGRHLVTITCHPDRGFVEFPSDPALETFDPSDRKFVAVTIKSGTDRTELVNAVDSDYREHERALREAGVAVRELCPDLLR